MSFRINLSNNEKLNLLLHLFADKKLEIIAEQFQKLEEIYKIDLSDFKPLALSYFSKEEIFLFQLVNQDDNFNTEPKEEDDDVMWDCWALWEETNKILNNIFTKEELTQLFSQVTRHSDWREYLNSNGKTWHKEDLLVPVAKSYYMLKLKGT